jgi:hypothetical protein
MIRLVRFVPISTSYDVMQRPLSHPVHSGSSDPNPECKADEECAPNEWIMQQGTNLEAYEHSIRFERLCEPMHYKPNTNHGV